MSDIEDASMIFNGVRSDCLNWQDFEKVLPRRIAELIQASRAETLEQVITASRAIWTEHLQFQAWENRIREALGGKS